MRKRNQNKKKIIIGLTGSFGSGKSSVAGIFRAYGARIIDADKLAHKFLCPGSRSYKRIVALFGKGILKKNKDIDRHKLSKVVFNSREALKKLNSVIHPQVIKAIKEAIKNSRERFVVLDAPLLLEAGLRGMVDKLVVVKARQEIQIQRIQKKLSLKKPDILKRIKSQISLSQKLRLADFIIDNNGTKRQTRKQVALIRRKLWIS